MPKPMPSAEELLAILEYSPDTGHLKWKERLPACEPTKSGRTQTHVSRVFNSAHAGKEALGCIAVNGYKKGAVFSKNYYAHRIIWKMMTGEDPIDIDHINGDRADNRFSNLRSVTRAENLKNRRLSSNNTSGCHGVVRHGELWHATIYDQGKARSLGYFKELSLAQSARKAAELKYGYHENHGRHTSGEAA